MTGCSCCQSLLKVNNYFNITVLLTVNIWLKDLEEEPMVHKTFTILKLFSFLGAVLFSWLMADTYDTFFKETNHHYCHCQWEYELRKQICPVLPFAHGTCTKYLDFITNWKTSRKTLTMKRIGCEFFRFSKRIFHWRIFEKFFI